MTTGNKTSPETIAKIKEMRAAGVSTKEIAAKLGVSNSTAYSFTRTTKPLKGTKPGRPRKDLSGGLAKLHELAAMKTPREKVLTGATPKGVRTGEVERLRDIVERLAKKYPLILIEVL